MKRLLWSLSGGVTLLLILAGGLAWLTATADGFRWLASELSILSQGRFKIEGVEGHLLSPQLAVRNLELTTDTTRIRIEHARLDWRPRALLHLRLDIRLLTAQRVEFETLKPSAEPVQIPTSLRLPFGMTAGPARIDLAQLDVKQAGETLHFSDIRLGLDGADDMWRLQLDSLVSPWASLRGQARIAQDAPFALNGHLDATHNEPVPVSAALELKGQLEAVGFELNAAAAGMSLLASGEVAPFADILLSHVLVAGQGIDPAQLVVGAPSARLAFSGLFEELPGKRLLGTFSLDNARAGKLDAGRMPLVGLSAAVLGDAKHADFSALKIDLGEAGRLTGDGQWRDGNFALNLASDRLNLAGLHGSLYRSRIRMDVQLSGDASRQRVRADVNGQYGRGQFALTHQADKLVLETLDLTGQHGGRLSARGNLNLTGRQAFAARFDLARFNPARFGAFPQARLNVRGQVAGALAPGFSIRANFELPAGELEGQPVAGSGRVNFAGGRLSDTEVDVNLAGNRVQLRGDYAPTNVRANWVIHAPALERLGRLGLKYLGVELAGQLDSEGSVSGHPARPQIKLDARAKGLRLPGGVTADSLDVRLDLQATASGAFNGELQGHGLKLGGQPVSSAHIDLQGRRSDHAIRLDVRLPDWHLLARAQGGLDDARVWHGRLLEAELDGAWPLRLLAPTKLKLGQDVQRIDAAEFSFAGGRVVLNMLEHQTGRLVTRGKLSQLPLAPLLKLLDEPPPINTDLLLAGEWDIRLDNALDGHVALRRQSGDMNLTEPAVKLGLTTLSLDVQAISNKLTTRLDVVTSGTGRVHAEGSTTLTRDGSQLVLLRSAPLAWRAQANLPDLRTLRPFLPLGVRADAQLVLDLTGSGTLAAPVLNGMLAANDIRFSMAEVGLAIRDGNIKLKFDDNTIIVSEGVLQGQTGRIRLAGTGSWRNPTGGLTLNFEKFAALTRSDRRMWLSGTTQLGFANGRLSLDGELRADQARLEMPEAGRPRLSDDVVVIGQPPRTDAQARRTPLDLNLTFDLGEDFLFKGAGLDARLGGKMRVFTRNEALRGEGSINVINGRYKAFGQSLDIERGVLTFTGPLDNPSLDILAVRKTGDVVAGVRVGGTVERPLASLYSNPAMPDTETLSWLVLGHGLSGGSGAQFELLQIAASALLSQTESASLQGRLADALSIDSFEVRGGDNADLSSTVVSVGRRVNSRLTMSYEQSLNGLGQVVKAIYQLSPKFRVQATAGSQSSVDVFYTLEFD